MEQSILKSTKKKLNVNPDDDSFDLDIIDHINSAFSTLNQLGVGPSDGFAIEGEDEEWADFLNPEGDLSQHHQVKTCVFIRVRLVFDPPATSFHLAALKSELQELEWRVNVRQEDSDWVDPNPAPEVVEEV